ncbi:MAG TPA: 5-methyltetrahydropteroyltriglutamate--homocysteine S-methyltransferase [Thiomicrorhabdus sp.]|nr:5-methyltetrahydropteroyltriglutamate--homocysteine S-methyltransferase [Thiomicrorhabdus sp.]
MKIHNLGYPRIGDKRQLKFALESYWSGKSTLNDLENTAREIRYQNFQTQLNAGIELLPVNDFAYYDQMLNMSTLLGVIPPRFQQDKYHVEVAFRMARGRAPSDDGHHCCTGNGHAKNPTSKADYACDMKKWFDTNYHYIVPELNKNQTFSITDTRLFDEVSEAQTIAKDGNSATVKPVLIGPLTYLYLAEDKGYGQNKLELLPELLNTYQSILSRLKDQGIEWVQLDEPILGLTLSNEWQAAFEPAYTALKNSGLSILLTTYFETLGDNLTLVNQLPIDGLHIDGLRGGAQLNEIVHTFSANKILSLGLIDGRNIWKTDFANAKNIAQSAFDKWQSNLWIAPSCSLLHVPVDLDSETLLDPELREYLSFAKQKLTELKEFASILSNATDSNAQLIANQNIIQKRRQSKRIHNSQVQEKLAQLPQYNLERTSTYSQRATQQKTRFKLPLLPTTTIGSFPQTTEIRQARRDWKKGELNEANYIKAMQAEIDDVIKRQEEIGIDVFVHGEPERNDMVEYFGEQMDGYAFTQFGWVQSYGSRCVKPPIIFGDVSRPSAMTVFWSKYAQAQTTKIMKGMLTGPVTMLQWSFVRDDQPRSVTCQQIALALRDEVLDLEAAGIHMIQIDEAALREGLPLKQKDWKAYLEWAVNAFKLTTSGVQDTTQIHTHMCYSEFNDIIEAVAAMDADVITIETSKSQMKLLQAFVDFKYPNEIGPGVYDIHSPNIPNTQSMVNLIRKAAKNIPIERLWVNPDCGLKTRGWKETEPALRHMVEAAKILRAELS